MKRRRLRPEQKVLIVPKGLKGRRIGDLCAEREISQPSNYQWRDQLLANAAKAIRAGQRPTIPGPARTRERATQVLAGELTSYRQNAVDGDRLGYNCDVPCWGR